MRTSYPPGATAHVPDTAAGAAAATTAHAADGAGAQKAGVRTADEPTAKAWAAAGTTGLVRADVGTDGRVIVFVATEVTASLPWPSTATSVSGCAQSKIFPALRR